MHNSIIKVDLEFDKKTVLDVLTFKLGLTKNAIKNLKFGGEILLNGERVTVRRILNEGDVLELKFNEKISENIRPINMPLDIIFEDDYILAVNKPGGMPTHPSAKNHGNTLANAVMAYYNGKFTFRAITRLDKYTSGAVLIAKTADSAAKLSELMKNNGFKKTYIAITDGVPKEKTGEITVPIGRCRDSIIKRQVTPDGKPAYSEYKVLYEDGEKSVVRVNIKTGRTHQIRVHMAHIGVPVYGDFLYGKEVENVRICLHCEVLEFVHPFTGENIRLFCEMPEDMKNIFTQKAK